MLYNNRSSAKSHISLLEKLLVDTKKVLTRSVSTNMFMCFDSSINVYIVTRMVTPCSQQPKADFMVRVMAPDVVNIPRNDHHTFISKFKPLHSNGRVARVITDFSEKIRRDTTQPQNGWDLTTCTCAARLAHRSFVARLFPPKLIHNSARLRSAVSGSAR